MFLGADTIKPLMRRLVPEVEYVSRPRFSTLSYTGYKKVTRLPPRSAVVAFAIADVFSLAELIRRQRGGTAVVLGALSPRARNAQVGMFQAGEVDYLVATDAIGMGLNMDLDHVAFARIGKFDGRGPRRLTAAEIAQIAGRAGRHMSDGTFGTTAEQGPLDPEIVEAIEDASLRSADPSQLAQHPAALRIGRRVAEEPRRAALGARSRPGPRSRRPPRLASARAQSGDRRAGHPSRRGSAALGGLPDPRFPQGHEREPYSAARPLLSPSRRTRASGCRSPGLPGRWRISTASTATSTRLMARIAHIRTWTYITHRGDWVEDAAEWQERARGIEDRLSDALHESITQRFVDRRSAFLVRQLASDGELIAAVSKAGEVLVEGAYVGRLDGLRFVPDAVDGVEMRMLIAAASRVLRGEVAARTRLLAADADEAFAIGADGELRWRGGLVGRMVAGEQLLAPRAEPLAGDFLEGEAREKVRRRLQEFLRGEIERRLAPLFAAQALPLGGVGRGLVFQLVDALGCLPRPTSRAKSPPSAPADRKALEPARCPLRHRERLFRAAAARRYDALSGASLGGAARPAGAAAAVGAPSCQADRRSIRSCRPHSMRRSAFVCSTGSRCAPTDWSGSRPRRGASHASGPFAAGAELAAIAGVEPPALRRLLAALGYRAVIEAGEETFVAAAAAPTRNRQRQPPARGRRAKVIPSPSCGS